MIVQDGGGGGYGGYGRRNSGPGFGTGMLAGGLLGYGLGGGFGHGFGFGGGGFGHGGFGHGGGYNNEQNTTTENTTINNETVNNYYGYVTFFSSQLHLDVSNLSGTNTVEERAGKTCLGCLTSPLRRGEGEGEGGRSTMMRGTGQNQVRC